MEHHDRIDDELAALVRSVERSVPPAVEERLRAAVRASRPRPRKGLLHRPFLVLSFLSGATAVLLGVLFMVPSFHPHEAPQIAEIRTEFVLADKNITIIFVQKPDFPVLLTSF